MSGETTIFVRKCIDRLNAGDDTARDELITVVCDRMQQLAKRMLAGYSRLRRWEETDDVFSGAVIRLQKALQVVSLESPKHFYRLAALQIRRELKELARKHCRENGPIVQNEADAEVNAGRLEGESNRLEPADVTHDPGRLTHWVELHERIEELPADDREVFETIWYHQLSQTEAAEVLGVSRRTVIRRWQSACLALHKHLDAVLPEE